MEITEELYIKCVGQEPTQDDLVRCNCNYAGMVGHYDCGWNDEMMLPNFIANYKKQS